MKVLITIFVAIIALSINCKAQSDTLLIHLSNSQIEKFAISQIQKIRFENITGIEEQSSYSNKIDKIGNNPNPFTDFTNIEFELNSSGSVIIIIYDNSANLIKVLECSVCGSGKNIITWDCRDNDNNRVNSGIYYYQVCFNNKVGTEKMILVK